MNRSGYKRPLTRRDLLIASALTGIGSLLAGCAPDDAKQTVRSSPPSAGPPRTVIPIDSVADFVASQSSFAARLLSQVASPTDNAVVSPFSVMQVTAMLAGGAAGATANQLALAIGGAGSTPAEVVDGANATLGVLSKLRKSTILNGAALFVDDEFPLQQSYVESLTDLFGARPRTLDLQSPRARADINAWISDQTQSAIQTLLKPNDLGPETTLLIASAMYLKADWRIPFNVAETAAGEFALKADSVISVQKMHSSATRRAFADDGLEIVELECVDKDLTALIIAPALGKVDGALALMADNCSLSELIAKMTLRLVDLAVPKFSVRARSELVKALTALGITDAFADNADFSGISTAPLTINKVLHEAWLKVDERGTEGAAATAATGEVSAPAPQTGAITVDVNRPFLVFVRERTSAAVLFAALIRDPR
ncbi:MAG: serpin family protein [Antricoccus sp.]